MNLWWFYTRNDTCSFNQMRERSSIPFGWSEIGDIQKYIKNKANWERQFKTFIQVKGDLAYVNDNSWYLNYRDLNMVPGLLWQILQIKKDDLIICIESGSAQTMGKPKISGIGQVTTDAILSYRYNPAFSYAHSVCEGIQWKSMDHLHKSLPIQLPKQDFFILYKDDEQINQAQILIHELNDEVVTRLA